MHPLSSTPAKSLDNERLPPQVGGVSQEISIPLSADITGETNATISAISPNKLPKLNSRYFQRTSRRYIVFPFVFLLILLLTIFSFFDLLKTIRDEIRDIQTITQLLANTATSRQTQLLNQQIEAVQATRPMIKNIIFYPITLPENQLTQNQGIKTIFFDKEVGVNQPVYLKDDSQKLVGYIHTTIDLAQMREEWLVNNLPMFGIIIILASGIIIVALLMVRRVISRLPTLEALSQEALALDFEKASNQQIDQLINATNTNSEQYNQSSRRWIFEKAMVYLLNHIRLQHTQIDDLSRELQSSRQLILSQILENGKIQNTMMLEIKMALKRVQAAIQLITNHYISPEQQDAIEIIDQSATELSQKMDQIVQLQRIERGQIGIEHQHFNPETLITNLLEKYNSIASEKGLELTYQKYHANYALEGDVQKITTVIASLLENALQYTLNGQIQVTSQVYHLQEKLRWQVAVIDTGIGIAEEHLQVIFDPFYQVNPDTFPDLTSLGVDLSLVKKLLQMIGGDIQVKSVLGEGTTFSVTFLVNNWAQRFDRTILQDKKLAVLSQQPQYRGLSKKFLNAGGLVKDFADIQLLLNHLSLYPVEALLIFPDYEMTKIVRLVTSIREMQQHQRMLIIYYYDTQHQPDFDKLRAAGVDYFEEFFSRDNNQDYYVKNLLKMLS